MRFTNVMQITINKNKYEAQEGETIIDVCRRNGINIPTLCEHGDLSHAGICRICVVKTTSPSGNRVVPACATDVEKGMNVITTDKELERARRINLELLWADHAGKCARCARNGNCELQDLAQKYDTDEFKFVPRKEQLTPPEELEYLRLNRSKVVYDDQNPSLLRNSEYCVECSRCIRACREIASVDSYGFNHRSSRTNVGTPYEEPLDCIFCGQCASHCPTAAIVDRSYIEQVEQAITDPQKMVVVQTAPAVHFSIGEMFGRAPGEFLEEKLNAALRKLGFDKVFNAALGADLTIMEEAAELIDRIKNNGKLPIFTSCCPSWVLFVEKYYPEFIPHFSNCKSPQQMLAPLIKTYWARKEKVDPKDIINVAIMPCTSRKYEAARPEMNASGLCDVDYVLTTRELARMINKHGINFDALDGDMFDSTLGTSTGAGILLDVSGGMMEATLRTAYEYLTQKELPRLEFKQVRNSPGIKEASITIGDKTINVAVVHEGKNARKLLEDLKRDRCKYHFVEVMACPNGCIGGGGQPIPVNQEIRNLRTKGIIERDRDMPIRKAQENPAAKKIYEEYLGQPGGENARKMLHTHYVDRKNKDITMR